MYGSEGKAISHLRGRSKKGLQEFHGQRHRSACQDHGKQFTRWSASTGTGKLKRMFAKRAEVIVKIRFHQVKKVQRKLEGNDKKRGEAFSAIRWRRLRG